MAIYNRYKYEYNDNSIEYSVFGKSKKYQVDSSNQRNY